MVQSTSAEVVLAFRMRDEASAGMNNLGRSIDATTLKVRELNAGWSLLNPTMQRSEGLMTRLGRSFNQNSAQVAQFSSNIAIAASSLGQLGSTFGIFSEEQQKGVTATLQVISATASLVGVIAQLNQITRINIILQAIARALSGPFGIAAVVAGLAVGVAAAATVSKFRQTAPGQGMMVPGTSTESSLAVVHGGEFIGRPRDGGGGGFSINISAGAFLGSQSDADSFAVMVGRSLQRIKRTQGFQI